MEYTEFGSTKEKVPRIGLGAWQFSDAWGVTDYQKAKAAIAKALELGMNLIDTAMVYGNGMSEKFIGDAIRELGVPRSEVFIVTKIPGHFLSYDDVFRAVDGSLRRLQTSFIDALEAHWPPAWHNIPTCEYARAFERLVEMGKVRYIGLSNYPVALIEEFRYCLSRHDVEVLELRYNIVERQAEQQHIPYAEANSMTVLAWSPLAQAAILGKYTLEDVTKFNDVRRNNPLFRPENYSQILQLVEELKEVAKKYDKTLSQVALNFLLRASSAVLPIPGAKSPEQVEENAGATGWALSYEDWRRLDEASKRLRISYVDIL
ncbi:Aldo-keto reductase [Acidilobus saccharovorans 345-15]|uniref:Aldo-keto reductase n=1 Tax=Acidilobus saccharovorans (strain DSM 16705 / JCM 18335 / VKM B-2471 / 345-15) TaxID=666510 RepID=D9Q0Y7_ACIS3|nr:aldo/keto reductase [Acidilobus saccharovorans]ADL18975.1 Aldo-keto reductase [Acidilobus saccharovorans 345-15]